MIRFLETFYRHRLLLLAPVFVTLSIALGLVLSQPRSYESSPKMWFDESSLKQAQLNQFLPPGQEEAAVLKELLNTRSFAIEVGHRGPLAGALAARANAPDSGPLSFITRKLRKLGVLPQPITSVTALDDSIVTTLGKHAKVDAVGPQVISVTYSDSNPSVAAGTAQAIVDQFSSQILAGERDQAQAVVDFYQQQVQPAGADLVAADKAVFKYVVSHPPARGATTTIEDPTLTALRRTDDLDRARYDGLLQKLDTARLDRAALDQPTAGGFRVLDVAQIPSQPVSRRKTVVYAGIGGLLGGLLIALITTVLLTLADGSLRRPEEVENLLGLRRVGAVPWVR